ncbi:hypothetical protein [Pseudomonas congelans]|uniref:hypothetical protein n=1 Tax=Pseudomonas congelans TaxID=200452 RepID=UPI001F27D8A4|nr:hypothetical protein [Pseudomonas congelans]
MVNVVLQTAPAPDLGARGALHVFIAAARNQTHRNATLIIDLTDRQACSVCDTGAMGNDNNEPSTTTHSEKRRDQAINNGGSIFMPKGEPPSPYHRRIDDEDLQRTTLAHATKETRCVTAALRSPLRTGNTETFFPALSPPDNHQNS